MTGDEIVQEIKSEQASRCDLYDVIIQDAYIDMNWTENLNDKVIGARDYSLKEMADVPSLQGRHVPGNGTKGGSDSHAIKLSKRCVSCWARHQLSVVLATRQLFASAEDQQSTCAKNGCFQTRWFG